MRPGRPWLCILVGAVGVLGLSATAARAQEVPPATLVAWREGAPGADRIIRDGQVYRVLTYDSLTVSAALLPANRDIVRVYIGVANGTGARVDVIPSRVVAMLSVDSALRLRPARVAELVDRARSGATVAKIFAGVAEAVVGRRSESAVSSNGTRTTIREDWRNVGDRIGAQFAAIDAAVAAKVEALTGGLLLANSLQPGELVGGVVAMFGKAPVREPAGTSCDTVPATRSCGTVSPPPIPDVARWLADSTGPRVGLRVRVPVGRYVFEIPVAANETVE